MTRYNFDFVKKPCDAEEFSEASVNELKVLVALFESGGSISEDELVERAGVSRARVMAALALWQEAGVISGREETSEVSFFGNTVRNEFPEKVHLSDLEEETSIEVARTIRDNKLASLFDECAKMMNKLMLTPQEIKRISELSSQYALSEEYILTLAAHLLEEGKLSVGILVRRAITLVGNGVTTPELLAAYIAEREARANEFIEYRRVFGIFDRSFSAKEKELLGKWSVTFAYGAEVVGLAYDIAVLNTSKLSFMYMDKLLTDWYENGCKTVADCEKRYTERKAELDKEAAEKREEASKRRGSGNKKPTKRYGDFDPEEAFRIALERSYKNMGDERSDK